MWLAGEHLEADKRATHRQEAARQALAAVITLGRRVGVTLGNRPLVDLIGALESIQFHDRTPRWLKGKYGSSSITGGDRLTQAAAVGAYVMLRAKGHAREVAAKMVANAMLDQGYRLSGERRELTYKTVLNWHRRRKTHLADCERLWSGASLRDQERAKGEPLTDDEILQAVRLGVLLR